MLGQREARGQLELPFGLSQYKGGGGGGARKGGGGGGGNKQLRLVSCDGWWRGTHALTELAQHSRGPSEVPSCNDTCLTDKQTF